MEITETLHLIDRKDWRSWLEENHEERKEIWLVFYKKHTKKPTLPYDDAVEEALCFGWIDGLVKRVDEEKYVQRFTPRKMRSIWSESNKERVGKMLKEGRMTEAGMVKVAAAKRSGEWYKAVGPEEPVMPPKLEAALEENEKARTNFYNFAPSYRKQYIWWIETAKREETRERRIREVVKRAEQNRKPGIE